MNKKAEVRKHTLLSTGYIRKYKVYEEANSTTFSDIQQMILRLNEHNLLTILLLFNPARKLDVKPKKISFHLVNMYMAIHLCNHYINILTPQSGKSFYLFSHLIWT